MAMRSIDGWVPLRDIYWESGYPSGIGSRVMMKLLEELGVGPRSRLRSPPGASVRSASPRLMQSRWLTSSRPGDKRTSTPYEGLRSWQRHGRPRSLMPLFVQRRHDESGGGRKGSAIPDDKSYPAPRDYPNRI
jgi:hypothetical protein